MGSKSKIAKDILPIILADRTPNQFYVEPFCGGCNTIDKVTGNRIAADANKYLIAMWKALKQKRDLPLDIPKELYSKARTEYNNNTNKEFEDFEIGWIGWMGSFNGRFFDGGYSGKTATRDYIDEQIRNTLKQVSSLRDVEFYHSSYEHLDMPDECIIYCDIPYKDTKQYATSKNFNHFVFWDWCRSKAKDGHTVFVSEYNAPNDFELVWQKVVTNSMNTTITYKPTERLFRLKYE